MIHPLNNLQTLQQLVTIAQQASHIVLQYYKATNLQINNKTDQSPVTQADLAAHQYISQQLKILTPNITVISEEDSQQIAPVQRLKLNTLWLVDPLDGTKEFIKQNDEFTINIALIHAHQSILGAIAVPAKGLVYAYAANKAYKIYGKNWQVLQQTKMANKPLNIAVSHHIKPTEQLLYEPFFANLQRQNLAYNLIEAGSAYKFCLMVDGLIDIYPRFHPTYEWDTAAGQGLIEALGSSLTTPTGAPFLYNKRDSLLNGAFVSYSGYARSN